MSDTKKLVPSSDSFSEIDKMLQSFLKKKGYDVLFRTSVESHGTFTYHVEKEGMPFWVKIGHSGTVNPWAELGYKRDKNEGQEGRIDDLKNEVAALMALWELYPLGETNSFQFPPGPEEVFETEYDGLKLYGYARFVVEGKVLGKELKDKKTSFAEWVEPCVKMIKTVDALPDLHLPRTGLKKNVEFEKLIEKNVSFWYDRRKIAAKNPDTGVTKDLLSRADKLVQEVRKYFSTHKVVTGTVHGDFQPDHIVYLEGNGLPTLVQFSKMCQWYPRYWDVANLYGWVVSVLGDVENAKSFWNLMTANGFSKDQMDYLRIITNVVTLGNMSTYVEPTWEGGKLKVGVEAFVK